MTSTSLQIGPYTFQHSVQSIVLQEQKALNAAETTRSSKNLIIDTGKTSSKAVIQFLFSGINEINTDARRLIALFRCCPVISCKNEMISNSWKPLTNQTKKDTDILPKDTAAVDRTEYNQFVPVGLEEISISSVPDLPFCIYLTLTLSKIDVSNATSGDILYQDENPANRWTDPAKAFWLKKWVDTILEDQKIPILIREDFDNISFEWFGKDIFGDRVTSNNIPGRINLEQDSPYLKIQAETCTIRNNFVYNTLIGKGSPSPQHMGSTSRYYSLDILSNGQTDSGESEYKMLQTFKEASDEMARSKNRENRIIGWAVTSPISKLLAVSSYPIRYRSGIFVPITVSQETSSEPFVKTISIDMIENNVDFFQQNEILLTEGGTDYDDLLAYYKRLTEKEYQFRKNKQTPGYVDSALSGTSIQSQEEYDAWSLFWPISSPGYTWVKNTDIFGVLSKETLKAVFLDPEYDTKERLAIALNQAILVVGETLSGSRQVPIWTKTKINLDQIRSLVAGSDSDEKDLASIFIAIKDLVSTKMILGADETAINFLSQKIFLSFLGDFDGVLDVNTESGSVVQILAGSVYQFHPDFLSALFRVLVERRKPPQFKIPAYSIDAVNTSFFKLIAAFAKDNNKLPIYKEPEPGTSNDNAKALSVVKANNRCLYPDLLLPTYGELYEDKWTLFAPTYNDFGIINRKPSSDSVIADNPQNEIAVSIDDYVSPAAWFFNKKFKEGLDKLLSFVDKDASAAAAVGHNLVISIPFDTDEIEELEELLQKKEEDNPTYRAASLPTIIERSESIIRNAIQRQLDNPNQKFYDSLKQLEIIDANEALRQQYLSSSSKTVSILQSNAGSITVKRKLTAPGVAGAIVRVLKEYKLLSTSDRLPRLDAYEEYRSADKTSEFKFIRGLDENTQQSVKSMIDQLPDTYESMVKLFPACKVYLVDKRGTDIVGDDSFFTVNPIVSIDITLDKEEADLAVIRVADPMYILQRDYFPTGGINTIKGQDGATLSRTVLGSLKGNNFDHYLKRFKLAQGRRIQIKMGYDSNPKNLKTVFTGRIAEIEPGDVVTIVAQGWKAELMSRQVAFANSNAKSWGAKDLAVQAITAANPDGFGDFYAQRDTNFILRNLPSADAEELARQVLRVQEGSITEHGERGFLSSAKNSVVSFFGGTEYDKENPGLDTRLKNIWYPEIPEVSNILGLRSFFQILPSQVNDSWVVPLQPAWEVLKEAARHTWNYIVQVVPYDGEATIFFGHPDQPYYYTKGNKISRTYYDKFLEGFVKSGEDVNNLVSGFFSSPFYGEGYVPNIDNLQKINNAITNSYDNAELGFASDKKINSKYDLGSFIENPEVLDDFYQELTKSRRSAVTFREANRSYKMLEHLLNSNLFGNLFVKLALKSKAPLAAYQDLKSTYLKSRTDTIIAKLFFEMPEIEAQAYFWRNIGRDMETLMSPSVNLGDLQDISNGMSVDLSIKEVIINEINSIYKSVSSAWYYDVGRTPTVVVKDIDNLRNLVVSKATNLYSRYYTNELYAASIKSLNEKIAEWGNNKITGESTKQLQSVVSSIRESIKKLNPKFSSIKEDIQSETLVAKLRIFVYYLAEYLKNDSQGRLEADKISTLAISLPPTMQVFRVFHNIDSDHDIVSNNIVASTRDMWNTVVIEYPERDAATDKVDDETALYNKTEFYSGIKWVYWPKNEVSGVVGLQFHPGLTLANKKIRVFTEINCQGGELAAKLACNRLAEGLRKMYRGTLTIKGRHIKPYDRIILNDDYTNMVGPVEVESVVHHWNLDTGWVSNIQPEAVCDSNAGAAVVQTAAMEALFDKVFRTTDFLTDLVTYCIIVATLGGGTPIVGGQFAVKKGLTGAIKKWWEKGTKDYIYDRLIAGKDNILKLKDIIAGQYKDPLNALRTIIRTFIQGPGGKIFASQVISGAVDTLTDTAFKLTVCTSFVMNAQKAEQLPVLLSPLLFNGMPFLAGLETEDPIWAVFFNGTFWSLKDMQLGAAEFVNEIGFGELLKEIK